MSLPQREHDFRFTAVTDRDGTRSSGMRCECGWSCTPEERDAGAVTKHASQNGIDLTAVQARATNALDEAYDFVLVTLRRAMTGAQDSPEFIAAVDDIYAMLRAARRAREAAERPAAPPTPAPAPAPKRRQPRPNPARLAKWEAQWQAEQADAEAER
jgi:hypothetical protein